MNELKPKGWLMWDKSLSNGFDECMFIHGFEKPTLTDEEQIKHGGDYRGHLWDSIPLYDNPGELEFKLSQMIHIAKELQGVILEYKSLPCKSLELAMFETANRYNDLIHNK